MCDFNPTRLQDGTWERHSAYPNDTIPDTCNDCHAIKCTNCGKVGPDSDSDVDSNQDGPAPAPSPPQDDSSSQSSFDEH